MSDNPMVPKGEERMVQALRALYSSYGYAKYKMNRFEEYDLYARNKDFLVSGNIITFTDTDGSLMALKPDVTLSIVKGFREESQCVSRVAYDEKVYRGFLSFLYLQGNNPGRTGVPWRHWERPAGGSCPSCPEEPEAYF